MAVFYCFYSMVLCMVLLGLVTGNKTYKRATKPRPEYVNNGVFSKTSDTLQFIFHNLESGTLERYRRDQYNSSLPGKLNDEFTDMNEKELYLSRISDLVLRNLTREMFSICPNAVICGTTVNFNLHDWKSCCTVCSCERSCVYTDSCCPHYVEQAMNEIDTEPRETFPLPAPVCQRALYLHEKNDSVVVIKPGPHYTFVSSCPESSTQRQRYFCRSDSEREFKFEDVTPLFDVSKVQNFVNRHCAQCNNMNTRNAIPWKLKLSCTLYPLEATELSLIEKEVRHRNDCFVEFFPPDERALATFCDPEKISTCNKTGLWSMYDYHLEYACSVYPLKFSTLTARYRNIFCAVCNGEMMQSTPFPPICEAHDIVNMYQLFMSVKLPGTEGDVRPDPCTANTVFDPLTMQCRRVYCTPPHMLNIRNKECVKMTAYEYYTDFRIAARAIFDHKLPAKLAVDHIVHHLENNILDKNSLCYIRIYPKTSLSNVSTLAFNPDTYITEVLLVIHVIGGAISGDPNEFYMNIIQSLRVPYTLQMPPFGTKVSLQLTAYGIDPLLQIPLTDTHFVAQNSIPLSNNIYWTDRKLLHLYVDPYDNTLLVEGINVIYSKCTSEYIVYDFDFLPCMTFRYNFDNDDIKRIPDGLILKNSILVKFGAFISINDTYVFICIDAIQQGQSGSASIGLTYGLISVFILRAEEL